MSSFSTRTTTTAPAPPGSHVSVPDYSKCREGEFSPAEECESYYICTHGRKLLQRCAHRLHWNTEKRVCDWPSSANCGLQYAGNNVHVHKNFDNYEDIVSNQIDDVIREQPCEEGTFSTSPSECKSYFMCDNGEFVKFSCPAGLHWNQDTNLCDWPTNAGCAISVFSGPDSGTAIERPSQAIESNGHGRHASQAVVEDFHNGEKDDCGGEPFRHHPTDCTKYYQCIPSGLIEMTCPPGTFWNMNVCDWTCGSEMRGGPSTVPTRRAMPTSSMSRRTSRPTDPTTSSTPWSFASITTGKPHPQPSAFAHDLLPPPECPAEPPKSEWDWEPSTATEPNTARPLNIPRSEYKVVCYFTNWAWYRPGQGKYKPSDIDYNLCTHIAYGFATLDPTNLVIRPHDRWADLDNKFYRQVAQLKARGLKVVLAVGGWNDSAGNKYSRLVNSPGARRKFIQHAVAFLETHCFDGLDFDWEYPKCWQVDCKKGPASDKEAFADFVREISIAFKPRGLLLSSAVSPSKTVIDEGYDVPTMSQYMDWISVMTYDFHGQWDKKTGHLAPLYFHENDDIAFFNTNYTIHYWIQQGTDPKKLIMGMPMYGQSFTLADANQNGLNAKTSGGGAAGEFTRQSGFLSFYEICDRILSRNWKVVQDEKGAMGPYAYSRSQWVSFDDINMIRRKSQYIKDMKLGGGMVWTLDLDDFRGTCGCGRHPLLKTINRILRNYVDSESVKSCMLR